MDLVLIIYLIDVVFNAVEVVGIASFCSGVACLICLFVCSVDRLNVPRVCFLAKVLGPVSLAVCLLCLFVPSPEAGYRMLTAYAAQEVAMMDEAKQVGGKAYDALNKLLDDYLEESDEAN